MLSRNRRWGAGGGTAAKKGISETSSSAAGQCAGEGVTGDTGGVAH